LKFHVYFSFFGFSPGAFTLPASGGTSEKGEEASGEKLPTLIPNPDLFLMTVVPSFKRISPALRD
jgi:hypothetical protein